MMVNKPVSRPARGFTLIEMLVAVAISLVVATLAYGFLSGAITAKESSDEALETVDRLETLFQLLATDLHHVVDRDLPGAEAGLGSVGSAPAFMGGDSSARDANYLLDEYLLRFVRDGWANPLQQQRSDLQRVAYRWHEGELWREYWPERNQPLDEEPVGRRLLLAEDLESVRIRFLPAGAERVEDSAWQDVWPPPDDAPRADDGNSSLPLAMEITLTLEDEGDVQRIFPLPRS